MSRRSVVAGEERDDGQALHRRWEVLAQHLAELVGLAFQAQLLALDLLVVLELQLEELHHLQRRAGCTGDGDAAVPIGGKDLLDRSDG